MEINENAMGRLMDGLFGNVKNIDKLFDKLKIKMNELDAGELELTFGFTKEGEKDGLRPSIKFVLTDPDYEDKRGVLKCRKFLARLLKRSRFFLNRKDRGGKS